MEIIKALVEINSEETKEILDNLRSHKFPIIAQYSKQITCNLN